MRTKSNAARAGQIPNANNLGLRRVARAGRALPKQRRGAKNATSGGQAAAADHIGLTTGAVTGRAKSKNAGGDGLMHGADHIGLRASAVAGRADLIADIRNWHRERMFAMNQRKRIHAALGAYLRRKHGWHKDLPKPERDKIARAVKAIIKLGENAHVVAASLSQEPWEEIEREAMQHLEQLAAQLPVWGAFGKRVRGFGLASLATIVAEAGDLSNYPTHSKLWKRLGLAVLEGRRQGSPIIQTAEEWLRHAYSPRRRSLVWNIGDALIKRNGNGCYRTTYIARKAYEIGRDPDIRPIIAHRRAQRYMEKKLVRDLWKAWRLV